jgi:PAS domain S-box-containing protein
VGIFSQMLYNQSVRATQTEYEKRASEARSLQVMLLNMDTSVRGYLLTRDSDYLHNYLHTNQELPGELKALTEASGGDSDALKTAKRISDSANKWALTAQVMVNDQAAAGKVDKPLLDEAHIEFTAAQDATVEYLKAAERQTQNLDVDVLQNRNTFKLRAVLGAIVLAAFLIGGVVFLARRIAGIYHQTTLAFEGQSKRAREASDLYRLITENSGDLISLVDADGCYTFVSPSFQKVLGFKRDQLVGKAVANFIDGHDPESVLQWETLMKLETAQGLIRHLKADGGWAFLEINGKHIEGSLVAVGRDVTERAAINEQLRSLNAELENRVEERTKELSIANKELEAFSYSVSHDLRAPLRSIASFSMILQQDVGSKLDEESQDNLRRIRGAAAKMTELIDALLTFSRIVRSELVRSEVDVSHIVESIFAECRRGSPVEVESHVDPGMKDEADPHLVRIAMENLIENAWKFTSKQERPRVEVGRNQGVYYVRDNGVGFEQQFVNKVFLPFERLHSDREFPGTGIGLATTKRIVDRHGGEIWAESTPNVQTTFYFTLHPQEAGNHPEA